MFYCRFLVALTLRKLKKKSRGYLVVLLDWLWELLLSISLL